jgi:hypothetical protein
MAKPIPAFATPEMIAVRPWSEKRVCILVGFVLEIKIGVVCFTRD